jgi:predicted small metal-binding protein
VDTDQRWGEIILSLEERSVFPEGAHKGGGGFTMLVFRCRDIGNNDCRFEAREATEEELLAKIRAHYEEERGVSLIPADILDRIRRAIQVEPGST